MTSLRPLGAGLLALVIGPLFGLVFGNAGVIYGAAGMAVYLAGRMGASENNYGCAARAGLLAMVAPGLAAGLPARWIAELLFYNRYITWGEQARVSAVRLLAYSGEYSTIRGRLGAVRRRQGEGDYCYT